MQPFQTLPFSEKPSSFLWKAFPPFLTLAHFYSLLLSHWPFETSTNHTTIQYVWLFPLPYWMCLGQAQCNICLNVSPNELWGSWGRDQNVLIFIPPNFTTTVFHKELLKCWEIIKTYSCCLMAIMSLTPYSSVWVVPVDLAFTLSFPVFWWGGNCPFLPLLLLSFPPNSVLTFFLQTVYQSLCQT